MLLATTASDWSAIGIAAVGAVTGILSLIRQIRSERRAGPMVKVTGSLGFMVGAMQPVTVLSVTASNAGLSPIEVRSWGLQMPDNRTLIVPQALPGSAPMPTTLTGGHSGTWSMPATASEDIVRFNDANDLRLTPFVNLGDGSSVRGKEFRVPVGRLRILSR